MSGTVYFADCLEVLKTLPNESVHLVVVDPPFNTGDFQTDGTSGITYLDSKFDYIDWMKQCIVECKRIMTPNGSIYVHLGEKISYKVRLLVMDEVFGEKNWLNTIIWHFDYGGRSKRMWSRKHETILMYAKDAKNYVFNYDSIDRIPYMAPGLQKDKTRVERGKPVTDTWWNSIVATNGEERVHYPNQKPIRLYERIVKASSNPGGVVLDFCCGSGTTLVAAHRQGRSFIGIDNNEFAIEVMKGRFVKDGVEGCTFLGGELELVICNAAICSVLSPQSWDKKDEAVSCTLEQSHEGPHQCGEVKWAFLAQ